MNPPRGNFNKTQSASIEAGLQQSGHSHHLTKSSRLFGETKAVWEDSGFLPPIMHQQAIELLHQFSMNGGSVNHSFIQAIMRNPEVQGKKGMYLITDPFRLKEVAFEYGIHTCGRRDADIAQDVTVAFIHEYLQDFSMNAEFNQNAGVSSS